MDVQWSVTMGSPFYVPARARAATGLPAAAGLRAPAPVYWQRGYHLQPRHWDRDGDGIPNRYDRRYNPRWDRDGDGVPNRYDRYPTAATTVGTASTTDTADTAIAVATTGAADAATEASLRVSGSVLVVARAMATVRCTPA